jgi:glutamate-1-semialdehyde 2,1-aminomutase
VTASDGGLDRARLASRLAEERSLFAATHPRSAALAAAASEHLLAGVPMAWMTRWPGSFPLFMASASGGHLTDVDDLDYVDFALGDTGAMCGHALPQVTEALAAQAARGITTMLPSADAIWVAAELARRFGLPRWQLAMTATDANRFALRLARYLTGRPKVVVFDWCYHGTVDETLANVDGEGRTVTREWNVGAPVDPALTTMVVPFNDIGAIEAALASGEVACVLAEPALTNIGIVLPAPGFHKALRAACSSTATLLVIDETHTICAGPGGATAAWGLQPDLLTIGKPIGGGMPAAAYGMTAAVAERLSSLMAAEGVDVSGIGGTLTGNALAIAAMKATLSSTLREEDFAVAVPLAARWADGVASVIEAHRLPWTVQRLGCRAEYWFCPAPADGAAAAAAVDPELEAFLHLFRAEPGRDAHAVPQHGAALERPHHRRRRPPHRRLRTIDRRPARLGVSPTCGSGSPVARVTCEHPQAGLLATDLLSVSTSGQVHAEPRRCERTKGASEWTTSRCGRRTARRRPSPRESWPAGSCSTRSWPGSRRSTPPSTQLSASTPSALGPRPAPPTRPWRGARRSGRSTAYRSP